MKFVELTSAILISCYLFLYSIQSEEGDLTSTQSETSCKGWFGPKCQYKCRCTNDSCDPDGQCTSGQQCLEEWFGPACQYSDEAYTVTYLTIPEVTDGSDETCVNSTSATSIHIPLTVVLTWFRVHFSVTGVLDKLNFEAKGNGSSNICSNRSKTAADDRTLDIHCTNPTVIEELVLSGEGTNYLCSVRVSGGRNLALRQAANQSTTFTSDENKVNFTFVASLAVDGNRHQHIHEGRSCSITDSVTAPVGAWELELSSPGLVTRYRLYNRDMDLFRLQNFTLESKNLAGLTVFRYKEHDPVAKSVYTITDTGHAVKRVTITTGSRDNFLLLCEVEIYGETICDDSHYGRDCELSCKCNPGEACFVSSGECPSGCPTGFHGAGCTIKCPAGKFGANCGSSCSPNCIPTGVEDVLPCDPVTGKCRKGCRDGFSGSSCLEECPDGKFGANCSGSCSPNCMPTGMDHLSACDPVTGNCRKGCRGGFTGSSCLEASVEPIYGSDLASIIAGLCLFFLAIATLGYCFCKRRTTEPGAEGKAASAQPEQHK